MSYTRDRKFARRRISHLEYLGNRLEPLNLRSLMGAQSVLELLDYARYPQLAWAASRLEPDTSLSISRDGATQLQERELHVALTGPGDESGRVEFEFERSPEISKFEISVRIRNADAGSTHDFLIDGSRLGIITVDARGKGRLDLSTRPGDGELPFSGGIPDVHVGSRIQIGTVLETVLGQKDDSTDNTIRPGEVEFDLFGNSSARGDVRLEQDPENEGLKTEFRVRIRDTAPGQRLNVFVNEVNVGQIVVDADGRGELELSTDPDRDELPFPGNFPELTPGLAVRVDDLVSGTLQRLPDLGPNGRGSICDESHFQVGLSGPTGAYGGTFYKVELEDAGFLEHTFRVHVSGGVPGETHDIRVSGINIGSLTLNDRGRGRIDFSNRMHDIRDLTLPDFFPDIQSGTLVEVGDILSGPLQNLTLNCPHGFASLGTRDGIESSLLKSTGPELLGIASV